MRCGWWVGCCVRPAPRPTSAPYGGPEASAPPSRRGGPGWRGVDGVRRVPPLEVLRSDRDRLPTI